MQKRREIYLREPLINRTIKVYSTEWNELKCLLEVQGSSMSKFIRDKVELELKRQRRASK